MDNVDASEIQNVSTSVSGPVTVVVEHLYHDHYQVLKMMLRKSLVSAEIQNPGAAIWVLRMLITSLM